MVLHPLNVPGKELGTRSIQGTKFDALFPANFRETIFIRHSSRVSSYGVEEGREEKIGSGYCQGKFWKKTFLKISSQLNEIMSSSFQFLQQLT